MKKIISLTFITFLVMTFSNCGFVDVSKNQKGIIGNKVLKTENRNIQGYTKVYLKGSFDVFLKDKPQSEIQIKAEENIIPYIKTELKNEVLSIHLDEKVKNLITHFNVQIFVPSKNINQIDNFGSGDIESEKLTSPDIFVIDSKGSGDISLNSLLAKDIQINVKGSGDFKINEVQSENISLNNLGSGDIFLSGKTNLFRVETLGSGDISAFNLKSKSTEISAKGSGDVNIFTSESITANNYGSGDITIKGKPKNINKTEKGSGNITIL